MKSGGLHRGPGGGGGDSGFETAECPNGAEQNGGKEQ